MKKKQIPDDFNIFLREGEEILLTAKPGKAANLFFLLPAIIAFSLLPILSLTGAFTFVQDYVPAGVTLVTISGLLLIFGLLMIFLRMIVMGRFYVITNQRVIVAKGKGRKSQMFLNLEDIHGVSMNQNLLYRIFRLVVIDFFSPSSPDRTKSFLIFSYTSTPLQFTFLSKMDGEAAFELLQKLVHVGR